MINVTGRTKGVLKSILIDSEPGPDEGLRLLSGPEGTFVLTLDTESHGDLVIEHEGYKVLLIGIEYLRMLDGRTIDCQTTEAGTILLVR